LSRKRALPAEQVFKPYVRKVKTFDPGSLFRPTEGV